MPELRVFSSMDVATPAPDLSLVELPQNGRAERAQAPYAAAYSAQELRKHVAYVEALRGNYEAAQALVRVATLQQQERTALIEAGRGVEREANYLARRLRESEAALDSERWRHLVDNFVHSLISLGLVALAVL